MKTSRIEKTQNISIGSLLIKSAKSFAGMIATIIIIGAVVAAVGCSAYGLNILTNKIGPIRTIMAAAIAGAIIVTAITFLARANNA